MKFVIDGDVLETEEAIVSWSNDQITAVASNWKLEIAHSFLEWYGDDTHVEIQTSGSTGTPKLIRHAKASMRQSALKTGRRFHLRSGMTSLNCLPSKYIAGKMMLIRAIVLDMSQVCVEPKLVVQVPDISKFDFAAMTPMQLQKTLENAPDSIQQIKTLILGGAPVSNQLLQQIKTLDTVCHATYGMTETITHIATQALNGPDAVDHFTALAGVLFSLSGQQLQINADHLDERPILTTDIVELLDHSKFRWLSRVDDVINRGGVKLFPKRIEEKLLSHMDDRFIITKAADELSGEAPVLVIEATPYGKERIDQLYVEIEKLPRLEQPRDIYFTEALVETETGKVKRDLGLYL